MFVSLYIYRDCHGRDHGVQPVPITTKVVSLNPVHGEVYNTM